MHHASKSIRSIRCLHVLHLEAAEDDRIAVPRKADEAFRVVEAFGWVSDLAAVEGADVHVEDLGAIERDFDTLALDFDLLEVPLTHRAEVAVLGADAVVEGAVILLRLKATFARSGHLFVVAVAVDDLEFEAVFGGVAINRCAKGDAVVASLWQLELDADDAVFEFFLGQEIAAFALLADDGTVFDLVVFHGTLPVARLRH